jgi:two-component system NarL family response regulator
MPDAANGPAGERIRIVVADDHAVVRMGLVALINSEPDLRVVGEAEDGREALELFHRLHPDVLLVDVRMPGMDGVAATRAVCQESPSARVIILSSYDGDEEIYRALEAGARGYLLKKDTLGEDMLKAIRTVHGGHHFIPPAVAAILAERMHRSELTPRELEVLKAIAEGMSNKRIAGRLDISEGTVKIHVTNILSKLGVSDRTEAATSAIRRGILRLE